MTLSFFTYFASVLLFILHQRRSEFKLRLIFLFDFLLNISILIYSNNVSVPTALLMIIQSLSTLIEIHEIHRHS